MKIILVSSEQYKKRINREVGKLLIDEETGKIYIELDFEKYPDLKSATCLKYEDEDGNIISYYSPLKLNIEFIPENYIPNDVFQIGIYDDLNNKFGKISDLSLVQIRKNPCKYRFGLISDLFSSKYSEINNEYRNDIINAGNFLLKEYKGKFLGILGNLSYENKNDIADFSILYKKYFSNPFLACKGNFDNKNLYEGNKLDAEFWKKYTFPESLKDNISFDFSYLSTENKKGLLTSNNYLLGTDSYDPNKVSNYVYVVDDYSTKDVFIVFNIDYKGPTENADMVVSETNPYNFEYHYFNQKDINWLHSILDRYRNERCFILTNLFFQKEAGDPSNIYSFTHDSHNWLSNDYTGEKDKVTFNQYLQLKRLNEYYTNAIWFSGHSQFKWDLQEKYNDANVSVKKENDEIKSAYNVHIPGLVNPIDKDGNHSPVESEGALVEIFNNYVNVRGIDFKSYNAFETKFNVKNNQYIEYSDFIPLKNDKETSIEPVQEDNMVKITLRRGSKGFKISKGFDKSFIFNNELIKPLYSYIRFNYKFYDKDGRRYEDKKEISTPIDVDTVHIGFRDEFENLTLENTLLKIYIRDNNESIKGVKFEIEDEFWNQFDESVSEITLYLECYIKYLKANWGYNNVFNPLAQYQIKAGGIYIKEIKSNLTLLDDLKPNLSDDDIPWEEEFFKQIEDDSILDITLLHNINLDTTLKIHSSKNINFNGYSINQNIKEDDTDIEKIFEISGVNTVVNLYSEDNTSYIETFYFDNLEDSILIKDNATYNVDNVIFKNINEEITTKINELENNLSELSESANKLVAEKVNTEIISVEDSVNKLEGKMTKLEFTIKSLINNKVKTN